MTSDDRFDTGADITDAQTTDQITSTMSLFKSGSLTTYTPAHR